MRAPWFGLSVLVSAAALAHCEDECDWTKHAKSKDLDNQTLLICCKGEPLQSGMLDVDSTLINASPYEVRLVDCLDRFSGSIVDELNEQNITAPRSLRITNLQDDLYILLEPRIFSDLKNDLLHLYLYHRGSKLYNINVPVGFIESFRALQTLHLNQVSLLSDFNSSISELTLENMYIDIRIHCRNLRVLTMRSIHIERNYEFKPDQEPWLIHNSTALQSLTIESVDLNQVYDDFLKGAKSLRFLTISGVNFFKSFYDRNIFYILAMKNLEHLDLSRNDLSNEEMVILRLKYWGFLKKLILAQNNFSSFCEPINRKLYPEEKDPRHLRCIPLATTVGLLDLSNNSFTEVKFQHILHIIRWRTSQEIVIDLRGNPVKHIRFEEEEFNELTERVQQKFMINITLLIDSPINCECHYGWLARALRDFPSFVVTARCGNVSLNEAPKNMLECTTSDCYPGCSCSTQWLDNMKNLTCKDLHSMPRNVSNILSLVASSNHIAELRSEDLPDSLKHLDLSNNKLTDIDPEVAEKLFSVQRTVKLAGNKLCHCNNTPLLKVFQDHKNQILDSENILCIDYTGFSKPLANILSLDDLCADTDNKSALFIALLSTIFALLTTLAICVALYYRYERSIKQYLYLRGCCLCCVAEGEEENDLEMLYDVFLSYCHKDEEFVLEELLPRLEEDQMHPYKVCIHFRDWIVGEFIPKQIAQSVQRSRRTLVLLSKNFSQSFWGLLEFRSAIMSDAHERRSRLIVLVLDDVVSDPSLDPEIKNYVRIHTYVRWDDPQFWEKLRFALPHRNKKVTKLKSKHNRRCNNDDIMLTNFMESNASNLIYPNDYTER